MKIFLTSFGNFLMDGFEMIALKLQRWFEKKCGTCGLPRDPWPGEPECRC